jgi:hypothetical protein
VAPSDAPTGLSHQRSAFLVQSIGSQTRPGLAVWRTFPPRTSSPIIRHAAVWIVRAWRSPAEATIFNADGRYKEGAAGDRWWAT